MHDEANGLVNSFTFGFDCL